MLIISSNSAISGPVVVRRYNDSSNNPMYMFSEVEPEYHYPSLNVNNNNGEEAHSTATYEQPQPSDLNLQITYQNLIGIRGHLEVNDDGSM